VPIEAQIMLAQAATVNANLLSVLGAGWLVRPPEASGIAALGILISVPRDQQGPHMLRVELLDAEGSPVNLELEGDARPLAFEDAVFASGRDDVDLPVPLSVPYAVTLPPFPLNPGQEYRWQLHIDGETQPEWCARFRTTPP